MSACSGRAFVGLISRSAYNGCRAISAGPMCAAVEHQGLQSGLLALRPDRRERLQQAQIKGWGPEDKECFTRLLNSGVGARELRFMALAVHLASRFACASGPNPNDALLAATIADLEHTLRRWSRPTSDRVHCESSDGRPACVESAERGLQVLRAARLHSRAATRHPDVLAWRSTIPHGASVDDFIPAGTVIPFISTFTRNWLACRPR